MQYVQSPFSAMSGLIGTIQQGIGPANHVLETYDMPEEAPAISCSRTESPDCLLRLTDVSFSYGDGADDAQVVLDNLNLSVSRNERVAIVGSSGSGKSTIAKLCCGLLTPSSGKVEFSCNDDECDHSRHIAYVPQSSFLFAGTIYENIAIGRENASYDEVVAASKSAHAHDFIIELENGYQTIVDESGNSLSGGQKQRISLARAFLHNAQLVILDEATSSLDNQSERLIGNALDILLTDRAAIIIAHRLNTIRNADRILVLANGEIVEEGCHDELILNEGAYAGLYRNQYE
jgi:ATP-binding cassette subfamily B protein/subfamily B ATP-binding cassette protein MsbA